MKRFSFKILLIYPSLLLLNLSYPNFSALINREKITTKQNLGHENTIIFNKPKVPDSGGTQGTDRGAGTGGLCQLDNQTIEINPLIALVSIANTETPDINFVWGETTRANPTFFFYVAYSDNSYAEFVLNNEEGEEVYSSDLFALAGTPGIVAFTLPESDILEVGKAYHWYFKIKCDRESSTDDFVDGWVRRVPELDRESLSDKNEIETAIAYAENGIWLDALSLLAQLRNQSRDHNTIDKLWNDLLEQGDLAELSQEEIILYAP